MVRLSVRLAGFGRVMFKIKICKGFWMRSYHLGQIECTKNSMIWPPTVNPPRSEGGKWRDTAKRAQCPFRTAQVAIALVGQLRALHADVVLQTLQEELIRTSTSVAEKGRFASHGNGILSYRYIIESRRIQRGRNKWNCV